MIYKETRKYVIIIINYCKVLLVFMWVFYTQDVTFGLSDIIIVIVTNSIEFIKHYFEPCYGQKLRWENESCACANV